MKLRNRFVFIALALLCLSVILALIMFFVSQESNPGVRPLFHYGPVERRFGFGTYWRRDLGMRDVSGNYSLYDRELDIYVVILAEVDRNHFTISGVVIDSNPKTANITLDLVDDVFKKTLPCSQSSVVVISGIDITVYQMESKPVTSEYYDLAVVPCILDSINRTDQPEYVIEELAQKYQKHCQGEGSRVSDTPDITDVN